MSILRIVIAALGAISLSACATYDPGPSIVRSPDVRPLLIGKTLDAVTAHLGMPQQSETVGGNQFIRYGALGCVESTCRITYQCSLSLTAGGAHAVVTDANLEGIIHGPPGGRDVYVPYTGQICNNVYFPRLVEFDHDAVAPPVTQPPSPDEQQQR